MAGGTESWEMLERWKADHPELSRGPAAPPPPRRLVPVPSPDPQSARAEQEEMIERWRHEHPNLTGLPRPQVAPRTAQRPVADQSRHDDDRRGIGIDLDSTPMTVLGAFIVGCIIGGIVMVIITGIAFWGFAGG
jgi:hypothetical protein